MNKLLLLVPIFFLLIQCQPPTPDMEIKPDFDWQGHRGARGILPENTILGFLGALEYPVTTLELDLAVSKDNQLIVSHEPWMSSRICSHPDGRPVSASEEDSLLIYQMTYAEIKTYDCGRRGNPGFPKQQKQPVYKPSLRDALVSVEQHCRATKRDLPQYNIEIKSEPAYDGIKTPPPPEFAKLLVQELAEIGVSFSRICIQSFDVRALQAVRELDKNLKTALLVANADGVEGNLASLGYTPEVYSPNYSLVTKGVVDKVHEMGMKIIPWTVNDSLVMKELIQMGVDGIITDYPDFIPGLMLN